MAMQSEGRAMNNFVSVGKAESGQICESGEPTGFGEAKRNGAMETWRLRSKGSDRHRFAIEMN